MSTCPCCIRLTSTFQLNIPSVRAAATATDTANTLASAIFDTFTQKITGSRIPLVLDQVTLIDLDRVIVSDQNLEKNGIYIVVNAGSSSVSWSLQREKCIFNNSFVKVLEGNTFIGTTWNSFLNNQWQPPSATSPEPHPSQHQPTRTVYSVNGGASAATTEMQLITTYEVASYANIPLIRGFRVQEGIPSNFIAQVTIRSMFICTNNTWGAKTGSVNLQFFCYSCPGIVPTQPDVTVFMYMGDRTKNRVRIAPEYDASTGFLSVTLPKTDTQGWPTSSGVDTYRVKTTISVDLCPV